MDTTRFLLIASIIVAFGATATFADEPVRVIRGTDEAKAAHVTTEHRIDRGNAIRRIHVINHNHQQDVVKVYVVHVPIYIELDRDLQRQGHGEIDHNMSLVEAQRLARYLNAAKAHVVRNEHAEASEMPVQAPSRANLVEGKNDDVKIDTVKAQSPQHAEIDTQPRDRQLTHDEVALAK